MERKFKVGDTVKDYRSQKEGKIVYIDEGDATFPYLIVFYAQNGICNSTWCKESDLTLIEPERKFKNGDELWDKVKGIRCVFSHYHDDRTCIVMDSLIRTKSISEIEPYTGQDKPKEGTQKERNSRLAAELVNEVTRLHPELKQLRPYTVILKSGVKVGISATMFDFINEQPDIIGAVQTVEDGKFFLHQIAAIVPTENLMP